MVMSRGTVTFLACFTGFWLLWVLVVVTCCLCGALRRRLKSHQEQRLREQCFRTMETEPLNCPPPHAPLPPAFCPPRTLSWAGHAPLTLPEAHWVTMPDADGNPPCYEEAVLMADPPPSYNQVLLDPLFGRGTFLKPPQQQAPHQSPWEVQGRDPTPALQSASVKPPAQSAEHDYSSTIHLPSAQRRDSLGQLLSNMDLNHNTDHRSHNTNHRSLLPEARVMGIQGFQELHWVQEVDGPEPGCGLPTVYPMLGRSTAV
ncbi:hypothetical protein NHX12_010639 [Muraenolepis orangiensis]|uniref:Proline-rich protein 7 n=1 Tax=Muraenolepis orangiensis TaxID=630683 RepID=A0A9Q0I9J6_9TELE|nr:hypothetical protein NHX12_010639 [Muraenolepis orangiensis]